MFLGELSVAVAQILADVVAIVHPATGTKRSRQQHSHFCDEMKTNLRVLFVNNKWRRDEQEGEY